MAAHSSILAITERIVERSKPTREAYLDQVNRAAESGPHRGVLSCGNLAHGFAACTVHDKEALAGDRVPNLGIITAYNDMLSAHQPFERYPDLIRAAAAEAGGVAQVAGGVPAMCDGVTQGQPGMDLSLFSRDVIALSAAVGLSHNMFDAAAFLGVCDKIVPGLVIGRSDLRPLAGGFHPGRSDDVGLAERRKVAHPAAFRRRQGRPRRIAGSRIEVLSRPRHLHLLRHRQLQSDADGDHGLSHARRLLHQPRNAVARSADQGSGQASAGSHRAGQRIHPGRRHVRRAQRRQRHRRPARHRRLDQPHHAPDCHGPTPPASG